jgi:membrane-associated protease RseP (regulator of RpoE activity)
LRTDDERRVEEEAGEPQPAGRDLNRAVNERLAGVANTKAPDRRITLLLAASLLLLVGRAGGWPLLIVIVALIAMIFLHELGHFIAAKASGMKVTEFFLGFGPKLWSFRRGETEYGVKAIPAGAYVRIIGMNNLDEVPPEDEPRTYRAQTYPRRFAVAVAGSAMHFLQALLCIFLILTITGAPGGHVFQRTADNWQIDKVVDGTAAQAAGLQAGDRVTVIDGVTVTAFDQLHDLIAQRPGKQVPLVIERGGHDQVVNVTLGTQNGQGFLGIQPGARKEKVGVFTAGGRSFTEFGAAAKEAVSELGSFFSPSGLSSFASEVVHGGTPAVTDGSSGTSGSGSGSPPADANRPISIVGATRIGADLTQQGLFTFLVFFATINLFIGIVNLIPLLPLDGGHLIIATYERIRSRRGRRYQVDVVKLLPLTYAVVMLLGLLFVSTVFLDLVDPISIN